MSAAIPIIICGKNPEVARAAKASLHPEYEGAIHRTIPHLISPHLTVLSHS